MKKNQETGHAKNVANLEDLLSFCVAFGPTYDPRKETLSIRGLNQLYMDSQSCLYQALVAKTDFDFATNLRRVTFDEMELLAVRIMNALQVSDAGSLTIDDAKGIIRKIQGKRAAKIPPPVSGTDGAAAPEVERNSVSQTSYDNRLQHFTRLIELALHESSYQPNEKALQTDTLRSKLNALKAVSANWTSINTAHDNAMVNRDTILYHNKTGLVQVSKEVKIYVKSAFGTKSKEFNQIKGIAFRVIRQGKRK